jgi:hypothetical protein
MMRRTGGEVKSPTKTKYVIEAFSSPLRRADAVRAGGTGDLHLPRSVTPMVWAILNRRSTDLPSFDAPGGAVSECRPNARKWRRSYVDGPGGLPYKPRQSRRIAAASRAAENIP